MAYQFIHIESFGLTKSKKGIQRWTVRQILAEADRESDACPHIFKPEVPEQFGLFKLHQIESEISRRVASSRDPRGRKVRSDALCLLAGVASYPQKSNAVISDTAVRAEFERWRALTFDFLQSEFGNCLLNVTQHLDEEFAHLHFYCVPEESDSGFNLDNVHPGKRQEKIDKNATGKTSKNSYRMGLRAFQDSYYACVGSKTGLARLGPRRRRLSRAEWRAEQIAAQSSKLAEQEAQLILRDANLEAVKLNVSKNPMEEIADRETSSERSVRVDLQDAERRVETAEQEINRLRAEIDQKSADLNFATRQAENYLRISNRMDEKNRELQNAFDEIFQLFPLVEDSLQAALDAEVQKPK